HPECAQINRPVSPPLAGQQVGNQKPADDEKDVNTEKTAAQQGNSGVITENGKYRQRPDSVDSGRVPPWPARRTALSDLGLRTHGSLVIDVDRTRRPESLEHPDPAPPLNGQFGRTPCRRAVRPLSRC